MATSTGVWRYIWWAIWVLLGLPLSFIALLAVTGTRDILTLVVILFFIGVYGALFFVPLLPEYIEKRRWMDMKDASKQPTKSCPACSSSELFWHEKRFICVECEYQGGEDWFVLRPEEQAKIVNAFETYKNTRDVG